MFRAGYITNDWEPDSPVYKTVLLAAKDQDIEIETIDRLNIEISVIQKLWSVLSLSDLVIFNLVREDPNIFYELGLAHGLGKPVIFIAETNFKILPADLLSQILFTYDKNPTGLENLKFRLSEVFNKLLYEKKGLKGLGGPREAISNSIPTAPQKERFRYIMSFDSGFHRERLLEAWLLELFRDIKDWDVISHGSPNESPRDARFDFIIWNSLPDTDMIAMGNPIPVEMKLGLNYSIFDQLTKKCQLQGFKSLIIVSTSRQSHREWISRQYNKTGLIVILLDRDDKIDIKNA